MMTEFCSSTEAYVPYNWTGFLQTPPNAWGGGDGGRNSKEKSRFYFGGMWEFYFQRKYTACFGWEWEEVCRWAL